MPTSSALHAWIVIKLEVGTIRCNVCFSCLTHIHINIYVVVYICICVGLVCRRPSGEGGIKSPKGHLDSFLHIFAYVSLRLSVIHVFLFKKQNENIKEYIWLPNLIVLIRLNYWDFGKMHFSSLYICIYSYIVYLKKQIG